MTNDKSCSIEEMTKLLDHLDSFQHDLNEADEVSTPYIQQEYAILKTFLKFRIQDIHNTTIEEFQKLTHPTR